MMSKLSKDRSDLLPLATTSAHVMSLVADMKILDKLAKRGDVQLQTLVGAVTSSFLALQTYLEHANEQPQMTCLVRTAQEKRKAKS